jgi:lysozyme
MCWPATALSMKLGASGNPPRAETSVQRENNQTPMSEIQAVADALLGIDVSHWQGQIDWIQVSEAGVKFAFIKATDGNALSDPMLKQNYEGAANAGIPFGLYHFWRPGIPGQADHFMNETVDIPHSFLVALDIETGALTEDNQQDALDWLKMLSDPLALHSRPLVYVSPSYAKFNLTDPAWLQYPLWTAHYTDLPQPNIDKWPTWMFWQRQPNATIPGISTPCDVNWFNGDAAAFSKLIQLPT